MFVRAYMRASTRDQDAERARKQLEDLAAVPSREWLELKLA
jgi:DNA invertase Pin-like site-specific DNA recombinase